MSLKTLRTLRTLKTLKTLKLKKELRKLIAQSEPNCMICIPNRIKQTFFSANRREYEGKCLSLHPNSHFQANES